MQRDLQLVGRVSIRRKLLENGGRSLEKISATFCCNSPPGSPSPGAVNRNQSNTGGGHVGDQRGLVPAGGIDRVQLLVGEGRILQRARGHQQQLGAEKGQVAEDQADAECQQHDRRAQRRPAPTTGLARYAAPISSTGTAMAIGR